tara:strand:- start:284 stop:1216 length:933 start_codon:yes stop_codon:yes gene_type:complete
MQKIVVFFISLVLVYNLFTSSLYAATVISKTKIHKVTKCEKYLYTNFKKYVDCLNEEIFISKHFLKLSKNKKNDIQSLLAISNILLENVDDNFITNQKAQNIWIQILNSPYKSKIKKKKLQKVLEQTTCMDMENYKNFITCFSSQFRSFEIYQKSDLLNKRRMETIVSNALYLTIPGSNVYAEAKKASERGILYSSDQGFNYFITYMNNLGTDYFKKVKTNAEWGKIIKFIIIAIIVAYLSKRLLKSTVGKSSGNVGSSSTATSSSSSGCSSILVSRCTSIFQKNIFRNAPASSVLRKPWFKYGFSRGFF